MNLENIIGLIVLIYGLIKVGISILKVLPKEYDDKFKYIKHDRTTAGYVLDGLLFIFGIYAILHGLRLMDHLHPSHTEILKNIHITVAIYTLVGLFMLVFYSIILYTNIPITKDEQQRTTYELLGLGGGFTFLLSVCVLLAWHIYHENIKVSMISKSNGVLFLMAMTFILLYANGVFVYRHLQRVHKQYTKENLRSIAVDLLMMPLASVS